MARERIAIRQRAAAATHRLPGSAAAQPGRWKRPGCVAIKKAMSSRISALSESAMAAGGKKQQRQQQ